MQSFAVLRKGRCICACSGCVYVLSVRVLWVCVSIGRLTRPPCLAEGKKKNYKETSLSEGGAVEEGENEMNSKLKLYYVVGAVLRRFRAP